MRHSIAFVLLFAFLLPARGSSARLSLRDGSEVYGKIEYGTLHTVGVETYDGRKVVRRDDVFRVDHPGNVAGTIGTALFGLGLLVLPYMSHCADVDAGVCVEMLSPLVVGAVLATYGWVIYGRSRTAWSSTDLSDGPMVLPGPVPGQLLPPVVPQQ